MTFTDTALAALRVFLSKSSPALKEIDGIEDVKVEVTWSPASENYPDQPLWAYCPGLPPR